MPTIPPLTAPGIGIVFPTCPAKYANASTASDGGSPSALKVAHRHGGVERPPGGRAEQAGVAAAQEPERVAHRGAEQRARRARPAPAPVVGLAVAAAGGQRERDHDREARGQRGAAGEHRVAAAAAEAERDRRAGDDDADQEHAVEEREEGQQHAGRRAWSRCRSC